MSPMEPESLLSNVRHVDLKPGESLMVQTGHDTAIVVRAVEAGAESTEAMPMIIRAKNRTGRKMPGQPEPPSPVKVPWVPRPPDRTVREIDDIRVTLGIRPPEPSPTTEFDLTGFIDARDLH